jgi:hypothetical protein
MPDSPGDEAAHVTSPQIYSQPLPPPESHGFPVHGVPAPNPNSRVVKAVLITVAVFIGLGVIGVGAVGLATWYFAKSIHNVPSATFTERGLGIAIYPGAEPSLRGSRAEIAGTSILSGTYFTKDTADQVIAFYKQRAGPSAHLSTTSYGSMFSVHTDAEDITTVKIVSVPGQSGRETYITITHRSKVTISH